jgi:hypothetical protein
MEHVIEHSFFSHVSDRGSYLVGSYPADLGISRSGDIYVSTNSFGILAFRKSGARWSARQITIRKRDNKSE